MRSVLIAISLLSPLGSNRTFGKDLTLELPATPANYCRIDWPRHFVDRQAQALDSTPKDNPTTDAGATLGRVLFYDTRLSADGAVSCGSCHVQAHGFSDPKPVSVGHSGRKGDRNSMGLANLRFTSTGLFWDERVETLEQQVLVPLQSDVEMGMTLPGAVKVVKQDARYAPLFAQAFGDQEISSDRIARALAQFVRALVSYRSKYDEGLASVEKMTDDFPNFTKSENLGKSLFKERCSICHQASRGTRPESFEMFASLNNGINPDGEQRDGGRGDQTLEPAGVGLFKASSLRNIERSAPYMHDGRLATLEDVVEHYSTGVNKHPSVSGFVFRMNFTAEEKEGLLAFLKTLTDEQFLSDPKFSNPWTGERNRTQAAAVASPRRSPLPSPLSAAERADRMTAGVGLPAGETLPWLQTLDQDRNQTLVAAELEPVVAVLVKTGASPRMNTQRFNRTTLRIGGTGPTRTGPITFDKNRDGKLDRSELPEAMQPLIDVGDIDGDQSLGAAELRKHQEFRRLIEIDDQGRVPLRVEQFVEDVGIAPDKLATCVSRIKTAQAEFQSMQAQANRKLSRQLAETMGPDKYQAFLDVLLTRPESRGRTHEDPSEAAQRLRQRLMDFDRDQTGKLETGEIELLAALLDESPGGFGQVAPEYPNIRMHARRLLAYGVDGYVTPEMLPDRSRELAVQGDADHDGKLDRSEAETYLRSRSFARLLSSGVYVGGGFGSVFGDAELFIEHVELSAEAAEAAKSLMQEHQRRVLRELEQIVNREYSELSSLFAPLKDRPLAGREAERE